MLMLSEEVQRTFIGGGDGSADYPYTIAEYDSMVASGLWSGGYVEGSGYTFECLTVTGSYNGGTYNLNNAISHLASNANGFSIGYYARYVRQALEAGGMPIDSSLGSACGYDSWLQSKGFRAVNVTGMYTLQPGDIVVFEALNGHPHGHIAMYSRQQ